MQQILNPKISLSSPMNVNIINWRCVYPLNVVVNSQLNEETELMKSQNYKIHNETGHGQFKIDFYENNPTENDESLNVRLELVETFEDAR